MNLINEEYVEGLVGAMKANGNEATGKVKVRYMGNMYARGPVFKVEGTGINGTANEVEEAAIRSGYRLEILPRKEDKVVEN